MKNKGFTIVELMAIIVILGILSTIAIVGVSRYRKEVRDKELIQLHSTIEAAYDTYRQGQMGKYEKDITIDVIAFNIDNEDDLSQLECTSMVTSGKFYNAQTAIELANSLNNSINRIKEVDARIIGN